MKKTKDKLSSFISNPKFEPFIVFTIVFIIFFTIFDKFSSELQAGNSKLLLSALGVSFAYIMFFISYKDNFINNKEEKRKIESLVEVLFVSSLLPVLIVLAASGKIKLGLFSNVVMWSLIVLIMISLFIFTLCIFNLWLFMLKKVTQKLVGKIKNLR